MVVSHAYREAHDGPTMWPDGDTDVEVDLSDIGVDRPLAHTVTRERRTREFPDPVLLALQLASVIPEDRALVTDDDDAALDALTRTT